jgi:negative regulator of sigma E activity
VSDEQDDGLDGLEPLTPEEEQAVSALLASLPVEPMPAEVFSRIEAALAAEPAPLPLAPVVTLNAPSRHKPSRGPMIFKVAASVVGLVGAVALGLAVVQGGGASSAGSAAGGTAKSAETAASTPAAASASASAAASSAGSGIPAAARPPRVSQSRFDYNQANLSSAATALATGRSLPTSADAAASAGTSSSTGTGATGTASSFSTASLVTTASLLDSCVKELTDGAARTPIAVDAGEWNHQPAVVIVLPALDDPTNLEVFVVKASCGQVKDSSDLLQFTNIPRP